MIVILTHDYFSRPGDLHLRSGKSNEDRISILECNRLTAIALCDGAGSSPSGAAAAELTARTLTGLLTERFQELYTADGDSARLIAVQAVEQCLRSHSLETGTPPEDLACTILAAAVDVEGRCICLHLGDGIILQRNSFDDGPSVVSCPMTGLAPHSTYLTMNCDMTRYLRYYRWQCPQLAQLMLLTDGAAEHLVCLHGGRGWVYTAQQSLDIPELLTHLIQRNPRDDYSTALISRTPAQDPINP